MVTRPCPAITSSCSSHLVSIRLAVYKEDNILIPMANEVIPTEQHASVWGEFDHVQHFETGEGVHEKYLALAEALEKEINS